MWMPALTRAPAYASAVRLACSVESARVLGWILLLSGLGFIYTFLTGLERPKHTDGHLAGTFHTAQCSSQLLFSHLFLLQWLHGLCKGMTASQKSIVGGTLGNIEHKAGYRSLNQEFI